MVAASVNHLVGFSLNEGDTTNDGGAGIEFEIELPNQVTGPAVYKNDAIYIPCSGNKIYRINLNGQLTESPDTNTALKDLVVLPDGTIPDFSVNVSYAAAAALESADQYSLVLYNEQENEFSVYDPSGNETAHFKTGSGLTGQFILADMDNNNLPDIVYILQDGIYAYSVYGYPISGFPIRPKFTVDDYLTGTPLVLDANDDDIPDLVCSTRKGQVLVYSINGQPVEEYQLSTGGSLHFSPIGMQLDNDDELELLAVSDSGTVYAWQMAGSFTNPLNIWRQANLLPDNNVVIATYSEYKPVGSDLMPAKKVFNYPNPNKGDFTNIRYYLNEQASVKIRILDAAGILVDEFSGPGSGQTANEIPWDVSNIASGVYVCQVEAKSQSTKETRIIKIMVIH
ncbi:MAG: T9SS type A sorting domain-containing protein [Calditrichaceae bacterium]